MIERSSNGQRTLAGDYFTSDEIYLEELEKIFGRRWLCAGHVAQLPAAGSYLLYEVGTESVIVLRDGAGELRAVHNVCRHRGSRLCSEPHGELGRSIRCPYHAWTYELDGDLKPVRHYYLGDAEAARAQAEKVARQAEGK